MKLENTENSSLSIREVTRYDIDDMVRIEKRCFSEKFRFNQSILLSLIVRSASNTSFAITFDGTFVGFILGNLAEEDSRIGQIVTIQIDPVFQRKQIGRRLLLFFENQLMGFYDIKSIELQVYYRNKGAICFYEANGYDFTKEVKNYYWRGDHAFIMRKNMEKV